MKKNSPIYYDNEIDLIALFKIIWDGKIKILLVMIISFLLGLGYTSQIPKDYLNSLAIDVSDNIEFIKLNEIQKLLKPDAEGINSLNKSYLKRFINELNGNKEFLLIIKNTKKIREHMSKLTIEDQERELFKFAKLLEIDDPDKNNKNYTINFKWHDPDEAKKLLERTLNLTSKNLKKSIIVELEELLEFKKKLTINSDKLRLDHLKEQSAIAKELNIIDSKMGNVNLYQSMGTFNVTTSDITYLRGYKAIDKEIEIIQNRSNQNIKFIQKEILTFKNEKTIWADYNFNLMYFEIFKDPKLNLLISILLGLIIGIFYVLISNAFQSKKASKKNI